MAGKTKVRKVINCSSSGDFSADDAYLLYQNLSSGQKTARAAALKALVLIEENANNKERAKAFRTALNAHSAHWKIYSGKDFLYCSDEDLIDFDDFGESDNTWLSINKKTKLDPLLAAATNQYLREKLFELEGDNTELYKKMLAVAAGNDDALFTLFKGQLKDWGLEPVAGLSKEQLHQRVKDCLDGEVDNYKALAAAKLFEHHVKRLAASTDENDLKLLQELLSKNDSAGIQGVLNTSKNKLLFYDGVQPNGINLLSDANLPLMQRALSSNAKPVIAQAAKAWLDPDAQAPKTAKQIGALLAVDDDRAFLDTLDLNQVNADFCAKAIVAQKQALALELVKRRTAELLSKTNLEFVAKALVKSSDDFTTRLAGDFYTNTNDSFWHFEGDITQEATENKIKGYFPTDDAKKAAQEAVAIEFVRLGLQKAEAKTLLAIAKQESHLGTALTERQFKIVAGGGDFEFKDIGDGFKDLLNRPAVSEAIKQAAAKEYFNKLGNTWPTSDEQGLIDALADDDTTHTNCQAIMAHFGLDASEAFASKDEFKACQQRARLIKALQGELKKTPISDNLLNIITCDVNDAGALKGALQAIKPQLDLSTISLVQAQGITVNLIEQMLIKKINEPDNANLKKIANCGDAGALQALIVDKPPQGIFEKELSASAKALLGKDGFFGKDKPDFYDRVYEHAAKLAAKNYLVAKLKNATWTSVNEAAALAVLANCDNRQLGHNLGLDDLGAQLGLNKGADGVLIGRLNFDMDDEQDVAMEREIRAQAAHRLFDIQVAQCKDTDLDKLQALQKALAVPNHSGLEDALIHVVKVNKKGVQLFLGDDGLVAAHREEYQKLVQTKLFSLKLEGLSETQKDALETGFNVLSVEDQHRVLTRIGEGKLQDSEACKVLLASTNPMHIQHVLTEKLKWPAPDKAMTNKLVEHNLRKEALKGIHNRALAEVLAKVDFTALGISPKALKAAVPKINARLLDGAGAGQSGSYLTGHPSTTSPNKNKYRDLVNHVMGDLGLDTGNKVHLKVVREAFGLQFREGQTASINRKDNFIKKQSLRKAIAARQDLIKNALTYIKANEGNGKGELLKFLIQQDHATLKDLGAFLSTDPVVGLTSTQDKLREYTGAALASSATYEKFIERLSPPNAPAGLPAPLKPQNGKLALISEQEFNAIKRRQHLGQLARVRAGTLPRDYVSERFNADLKRAAPEFETQSAAYTKLVMSLHKDNEYNKKPGLEESKKKYHIARAPGLDAREEAAARLPETEKMLQQVRLMLENLHVRKKILEDIVAECQVQLAKVDKNSPGGVALLAIQKNAGDKLAKDAQRIKAHLGAEANLVQSISNAKQMTNEHTRLIACEKGVTVEEFSAPPLNGRYYTDDDMNASYRQRLGEQGQVVRLPSHAGSAGSVEENWDTESISAKKPTRTIVDITNPKVAPTRANPAGTPARTTRHDFTTRYKQDGQPKVYMTGFPTNASPEAKAQYAFEVAKGLLRDWKGKPGPDNLIMINPASKEEAEYLWAAFVLIGDKTPGYKFGPDAIEFKRLSGFNPKACMDTHWYKSTTFKGDGIDAMCRYVHDVKTKVEVETNEKSNVLPPRIKELGEMLAKKGVRDVKDKDKKDPEKQVDKNRKVQGLFKKVLTKERDEQLKGHVDKQRENDSGLKSSPS